MILINTGPQSIEKTEQSWETPNSEEKEIKRC